MTPAMATRLSNDEFLTNLSTLLTSTHSASHGSIYLTQKPLPSSSISSPANSDSPAPPPFQILLRASNGVSKKHQKTKIRLSTVLDSQNADAFYVRYAEVCKKGMEGLRKRDKKKAKEKAKKRKGKGGGEK